MYCGDEVSAIVGDIGGEMSKFGYAGEDTPRAVFHSSVGHRPADGTTQQQFFVGDSQVTYARSKMRIRNPICQNADVEKSVNGELSDWEVVEKLWEHALSKSKLSAGPSAHPVLLVEPTINPAAKRATYIGLMFEKFQVPATYLAKDTVLAAFGSGRSTALVALLGGSSVQIVPVTDGYALRKGTHVSPVAGRWLSSVLRKRLKERGVIVRPRFMFSKKQTRSGEWKVTEKHVPDIHPSFRDFMELNILRDMKDTTCKMADTSIATALRQINPVYVLPDGTKVDLSTESTSIPELLLKGSLITTSSAAAAAAAAAALPMGIALPPAVATTRRRPPLADAIRQSVGHCEADMRRELLNHIVLAGGTSLIPGMPQRFTKELDALLPSTHRTRIVIPSPLERRFASWIGGSILSSLGSFQQLWISKAEYEEGGGSAVVARRCS